MAWPPPKGGSSVTSVTRNLLANRDAIRRQMQEAEELRKRAFYESLMQASQAVPDATRTGAGQIPVLPNVVSSRVLETGSTQTSTELPPDPVLLPELVRTPRRGDEISRETLERVRPGGRAEARLVGVRPAMDEVIADPRDVGNYRTSQARHEHLMGETVNPETGLMRDSFNPAVATQEEIAERRKQVAANNLLLRPGSESHAFLQAAADVPFYKTGGALRFTGSMLQRMADSDARAVEESGTDSALARVPSRLLGAAAAKTEEAAQVFFRESDMQREEMNTTTQNRSILQPDRQTHEKPTSIMLAQLAGGMTTEVASYALGGGLVKQGLRGMGVLKQATKFVPKHKNTLMKWGESIADQMKKVGTDVLAFGGIDIASSQREKDAAATFVRDLTSPEMLEKLRQGEEGAVEGLLDGMVIDNFLPWVNEVAAIAVETAAGRAAFEMVLGGSLDTLLRGAAGGVRMSGLNPLMDPSMVRQGGMIKHLDETVGTRQLELGGGDAGVGPLSLPSKLDSGIDVTKVGEAPIIEAAPTAVTRDKTQRDLTGLDIDALDRLEVNTQAIDRAALGLDDAGQPAVTDKGNRKQVKTLLNEQAKSQFGLAETDVRAMGVDVKDSEAYAAFLHRQSRSVEAPGTPDIGTENIERASWIEPDRESLVQLALKGDARDPKTRFWYEESEKMLRTLVPEEEYDEFVRFLATFSMNTDPKTNLMEAMLNWNNIKRGDPVQGVLGSKKDKSKQVLAGRPSDTPKIWSFAENGRGNAEHVTMDVWGWRILLGVEPSANVKDQAFIGLKYAQAREEFRAVARELTERTGDTWTPMQVQAATWVEFRDNWIQTLGGKPSGNDSFADFAESVLGKIAVIEEARAKGLPKVISEAMPSPDANRIKRMSDGTADVQTRTEYSEARFRAVVPVLRKVVKELGIADAVGGAYGVDSGLQKSVRPAQSKASLAKGETLGQGGTWEGKWNSNLPFLLPPDTPPSTVRMIAAVMGDLLEQDAVVTSTLRKNDVEAVLAAKELAGNPTGLAGENSGVAIVTRRFLNKETSENLARHIDLLSKSDDPLANALKDVNFTQSGDVLHFIDFSGGAPQRFWDVVHGALESFENGRFWDDLADTNDMRFARTDGELIGDSYGKGQWDEVFNAARSEAAAADAGGRTLRPDFLEANRNNIRKKFDDIDGEFREKLDQIERNASRAVEDPRVTQEPVRTKQEGSARVDGEQKLKGRPIGAWARTVGPTAAGATAGGAVAYGTSDPDDPNRLAKAATAALWAGAAVGTPAAIIGNLPSGSGTRWQRYKQTLGESAEEVAEEVVEDASMGAVERTLAGAGKGATDTGVEVASRPEVAGFLLGATYGASDSDDHISPLVGGLAGAGLVGGSRIVARTAADVLRSSDKPIVKQVVKMIDGKPKKVVEASDAEVESILVKMMESDKLAGTTKPEVAAGPPTLPASLNRASPRYRDMSVRFESDIDRAAYIVRNRKNRSQADQEYVKWLESKGISESEAVSLGNRIADKLKRMYTGGHDGVDELVVAADAKINARFQPETPPPVRTGAAPGDIDPAEFVNVEKFDLDPANYKKRLEEAIREVVAETGMDPKQIVTHKQTIKIAESLGLQEEDLLLSLQGPASLVQKTLRPSRSPSNSAGHQAAVMLAVRNRIRASVRRATQLREKLHTEHSRQEPKFWEKDQPVLAIEREIDFLDAEVNRLLAEYMPAASEAGRTLNALKIAAQDTMDPVTWMMRAAKIVGDPTGLDEGVKDMIVKLTRENDKAGLMRLMRDLNVSGIAEQITTMGKAFMLSALPTHAMNLVSTAAHVIGIEEFKELPAGMMDAFLVKTAIATERSKSWGGPKARLEVARQGFKQGYESAADVLKGNPLVGSAEKWDQAKHQINITLARQIPGFKHVPYLPKAIDSALQSFQKTVFGSLGAGDAMLSGFGLRGSLLEQARVKAINEGHKGAAFEDRWKDILENELTAKMWLEAFAAAELGTFRGRTRVSRAIVGLKRGLSEYSKDTANPWPLRTAAGAAFTAAERQLPFVQTPLNVAVRAGEASPIGLGLALADIVPRLAGKAVTEIPVVGKSIDEALGLTKKIQYKNGDQKRVMEMLGRGTVGTGYVAIGSWLYNQGIMSLGYTQEKQGQRMLTGEDENTVKIGDEYVSAERLAPVGNLILMGGYLARSWETTGDPDVMDPYSFTAPSKLERIFGFGFGPDGKLRITRDALLEEGIQAQGRIMIEQTFLTGVRELLEQVRGTEREGSKSPLGIEGWAQISAPNVLKRFERYLDPVVRVRSTPRDYLTALGVFDGSANSTELPARLDAFGKELRYTGEEDSNLSRAYRTMVDPLMTSRSLTGPNTFLRSLLKDLDVNVARRQKDKYETPEMYESRQRTEGAELELALTQFVASRNFARIEENLHNSPHFQELYDSGWLTEDNAQRLLPALVKALQAEAISAEISRVRSAQSRKRAEPLGGGVRQSTQDIEKMLHQQRLLGRRE